MDIQTIKELLRVLKRSDVTEFEWEHKNHRVSIRRGARPSEVQPAVVSMMAAPQAVAPVAPAAAPAAPAAAAPAAPTPAEEPGELLTSPIVGTFYSAPSPESPAFVKEGQIVEKGQTLCIVEAMKLMNEIEADFKGRILKVLIENAQPVEYGEPLFRIERLG